MEKKWIGFFCFLSIILGCLFYTAFYGRTVEVMFPMVDATIVLDAVKDVLTIPAAALVENGNHTVVYTGYDEEQEMLLDPVMVQVGCSDGESVEILEGLENGQIYYYAYYDTLEISFTPDFGGGFMFG